MYALIFPNGTQLTMSLLDVEQLARDKGFVVKSATSNGAQTEFTADCEIAGKVEVWKVVANCYSEGEVTLYANKGRHS